MPTTIEITREVQDKVLESMKVGQRAVVDSVRSWASTAETLFSRLPDLVTAEPNAKPGDYFQSAASFTDRVLTSQREFVTSVYEAFVPAAKAAANSVPQTGKAATSKLA